MVAKGMTISDYLFFCVIDKKDFLKAEEPIAKYDTQGHLPVEGLDGTDVYRRSLDKRHA